MYSYSGGYLYGVLLPISEGVPDIVLQSLDIVAEAGNLCQGDGDLCTDRSDRDPNGCQTPYECDEHSNPGNPMTRTHHSLSRVGRRPEAMMPKSPRCFFVRDRPRTSPCLRISRALERETGEAPRTGIDWPERRVFRDSRILAWRESSLRRRRFCSGDIFLERLVPGAKCSI